MDLEKHELALKDFEKWYKDNIGIISFYKFTEVCVFEMKLGVYWAYFTEKGIFFCGAYEARRWVSIRDALKEEVEQAFKIRNEQLKNK